MPESQRMRSAVSVTPSSKKDVKRKLAQAKQLEDELMASSSSNGKDHPPKSKTTTKTTTTSTTSKNSEEWLKRMRQLMGLFYEIIDSYPIEARQHKCLSRMFTCCVYDRVQFYRKQISKFQKRQKTNKTTADGSGGGEPSSTTMDNNRNSLRQVTDHFHQFLDQCIKTFDTLRRRYESRLVEAAAAASSGDVAAADGGAKKKNKRNNQSTTKTKNRTNSREQTNDDDDDHDYEQGDNNNKNKNEDGDNDDRHLEDVVANLYKIYMILGDLERYKESNEKAKKHYASARSIAPGSGQVYNQFGSIAYSSTKYMESLYYYVRCLYVTHETFNVKQVNRNLSFLEDSNLKQITELERGHGIPIVLPDGLSREAQRDRKKSASNSCTRYFIKLVFDMLREVNNNVVGTVQQSATTSTATVPTNTTTASFVSVVTGKDDIDRFQDQLREQTEELLDSLRSMFKYAVFSDASICKMVIILFYLSHTTAAAVTTDQSMNEKDTRISKNKNKSKSKSKNDKLKIIRSLSKQLLLSFGLHLSQNLVQHSLKTKIQSASPSKPPPYVKCLAVLEILVESIIVLTNDARNSNETDTETESKSEFDCNNMETQFWEEMIHVGNLVVELTTKYDISEETTHDDDDDSMDDDVAKDKDTEDSRDNLTVSKIHEYRDLKGFKLLPVANLGYEEKTDMYISPRAAMEALEIGGTSRESQDTRTTSTSGSASPEEQRAKLHRMIQICHRLASDSGFPVKVSNSASEPFAFATTGEDESAMNVDEESDYHDTDKSSDETTAVSHDSMDVDESPPKESNDKDDDAAMPSFDVGGDDEAGDTVVYKPQQSGGPDLLVPAQLLAGGNPSGIEPSSHPSKPDKENGLPPLSAPIHSPPGIRPPPGFGAPPPAPTQASSQDQGINNPPIAPIIGQYVVGGHSNIQTPNVRDYNQLPLDPAPIFLNQPSIPVPGQAVVNGFGLYVDDPSKVRTANPFVPKDYQLQMTSTTTSYQPNAQQELNSSTEGEGLLPAGLLTSLWTDDPTPSKNPWAK